MGAYARRKEHLLSELRAGDEAGLTARERAIGSAQDAVVPVGLPSGERREALNLCANNYLGLANHPRVVAAAQRAAAEHGFGVASVRFICGTQDVHLELERRLS